MRRSLPIVLLCLLAAPALADSEVSGQTPGGAYYRIVVPDVWNGSLVIYNHGYSFGEPGPEPDLGELQDVQLLQGFAVAASSYRQRGWALFKSTEDLVALVDEFRSRFGEPASIYLYGGSLGGLVTVAAIEKASLGNVVGALSACGALAGSRNWEGSLDLRLLYDQVCSKIPAARLPGGAEGLPEDSPLTFEDVAAAVDSCMGVELAPGLRSRRQRRNLKTFLRVSGLPESFVSVSMIYATIGMSDLVHSPDKLGGRLGVSNLDVDYGNRKVNRGIERVKANRRASRRLARSYTPTGKLGSTKVIAAHTDKDGLVIVENLREYAELAPPENLTAAVVVESLPSHCLFTTSEVLAAWDGLVDWVASGVQPDAADLQATCLDLEPVFGGPCRIDPDFVIPDMDGRIRPR